MKLLLYLLTSLHGTKRTFLVALIDVRFGGKADTVISRPPPSRWVQPASPRWRRILATAPVYLSPRFGIPH
jgi:hypothetical protein